MKLRSLFGRAGFMATAVLALIVGAVTLGTAANISLSTGAHFVPTGPALFQGSDLNTMVDQINTNTAAIAAGGSGAYTGTFNGVVGGVTPAAGTFTTLASGVHTITSASAAALAVGRLGATTPAFNIDASAGTSITGLNLAANSTGNGVALTALGGTNEPMFVAGKGTGALALGGTTSTLAGLLIAQTASRVNGLILTPGATGTAATLVANSAGADANVGVSIAGNGTGPVLVGGTTTTVAGLQVAQTASAVNDLLVTNGATGTSVVLSANSAGADTNAGITMTNKGSGRVVLGAITTCSGTTTATCTAVQRMVVSVTGLTTAAGGTESAAMTVTSSAVLSSAVPVMCAVNGYAGTGDPVVTRIIPGTGSFSFTITNVAASGSLNATVPVACIVL